MKSKKKHINQDFEVVDGIGKYMDDDIQRIIEGKQLELGDRELPPFDEYRIYKNMMKGRYTAVEWSFYEDKNYYCSCGARCFCTNFVFF